MLERWQLIVERTRRYRDSSLSKIVPEITNIPAELPANVTGIAKQVLTIEEIAITDLPPENLLDSLASGTLSSLDVTNAFLRRAALAQHLVNCIIEVMPERALERAKQLDNYLTTHKRPIGPLHGLPISLKEHHSVQGLNVSCGFVAWHDRVAQMDSHAVSLLQRAGAVIYVRTTEPQTLMHLETSSNLFGDTVNPYNNALTCGGSSGGEAALLALHGSCLGFGSDMGGSIRNPAAMNGIWGFRPSAHRIPLYGVEAATKGYDSITPVVGPLSTSIEGLHVVMKTIIDQMPWVNDPSLVPMPWSYPPAKSHLIKADGQRRLKVAFLWHDHVVRPHPPVTRALKTLANKLHANPNIRIADWKPYKHDHCAEMTIPLYFPDGGAAIKKELELSGEPWHPLTTFVLEELGQLKELSISDLWSWNIKRMRYCAEYTGLWNSTATEDELGDMVDVIISPIAPGVAQPLNHTKYFSYTAQWNLLDYPAMAFPFGFVDQELDRLTAEDEAYVPQGLEDARSWKLWVGQGGAAGYKDAPIGLQIVGRRFQDEKVFEAMQWIKQVAAL